MQIITIIINIISEYYPATDYFSSLKERDRSTFISLIFIPDLQSYTWESPTFSRRGGISEERGCYTGCERRWWRGGTVEAWCRCGRKRGTFHGRLCPSSAASSSTSSSTTDASSPTSTLARGATLWCTGSATPTGPSAFPAATTATGTPAAARHHYSLWCSGKSPPYCYPLLWFVATKSDGSCIHIHIYIFFPLSFSREKERNTTFLRYETIRVGEYNASRLCEILASEKSHEWRRLAT